MIVPVVERRAFDFSATSGPDCKHVLARHLDVLAYRTAILLVRVHAASVAGAGATLKVEAFRTSPSPDDPETDFVDSTALATANITSSTAQTLLRHVLATPFGSHVQLRLIADPSPSPAALSATLSVAFAFLRPP